MFGAAVAALLVAGAPIATQSPAQGTETVLSEEQAKARYDAAMKELESQLHPQSGTIHIKEASARLNLGDRYYFLPAAEAKRVLTEAWGNPPETSSSVLGMIFPAGRKFNDATWGAVIEYEETGHISDKDAASEDYGAVLADMKSASEEANAARKEQGYSASHVIGWAQAPTYDPATKTLIWARNIKFDDSETNTLNYDVRTLSRTGVLSLNMVDTMPNLPVVKAAATTLGSTVQFDQGARYADFDPSTDNLADYGLAGLVAGGAGLAVAKKVGLLGILALVLKKGFVVILAGAAGLFAWFKRRFGAGSSQNDEDGTGYSG